MNLRLLVLPILSLGVTALADEPKPAAAKPAETTAKPAEAAAKAARYQPKAKSSFGLQANTRSPFQPIGYVRRSGEVSPVVAAKVEVDESLFRVTSILLGNPSLAVINGRSYEEGQFIRMPKAGPQIKPRLYRIADGQVWIQVDAQLIQVTLKRDELNGRPTEPEMLNSEKDEEAPSVSKR